MKAVPASNERDALELRLQVGLAMPLTGSQGFESDQVVAVLSRASELNQRLADSPQSFGALRGLYQLLMGRGDYQGTLDLCDKLDRIAKREAAPAFVAEATRLRGLSAFFLGRLMESQDAFAQSLISYGREERTSKLFAIADDPQVTGASFLSLVLWMLGYPDQALQQARDGLRRAISLGAPYSIAIAHCFLAMLMRFLRDYPGTTKEAESAIAIATSADLRTGARKHRSNAVGRWRCKAARRPVSRRYAPRSKQAHLGSVVHSPSSLMHVFAPGKPPRVCARWMRH